MAGTSTSPNGSSSKRDLVVDVEKNGADKDPVSGDQSKYFRYQS